MLNFDEWEQLLRRYVDEGGRVNYQAWKAESVPRLQQWLQDLGQVDMNAYPDKQQRLAFWINLYNALTIAQVLELYPIDSIRPQVWGIPNWLGFFWFFSRPVFSLGGQRYSLNNIEHQILREQFNDPRIHFALVCGAVGCPLLRNGAYWPEIVETQLEDDAWRFINNLDKVRYDAETGKLFCSRIFQWYKQDFCLDVGSTAEYITAYLRMDVPVGEIRAIAYLPYDWSLNKQSGQLSVEC